MYSYDPEHLAGTSVNLTDPEELEAHLQVLDVRQRLRQRRRRMIRMFSVVFLLTVVAFLVLMGLSSKDGKENSEIQSGDSVSGSTYLSSPPADLSSKCSTTALVSAQGIEACEEACEVADCCSVPDGYALSCLADNTMVCAQYQRYCSVLDDIQDSGIGTPTASTPTDGGITSTPPPVSTPVSTPQDQDTPTIPPSPSPLQSPVFLVATVAPVVPPTPLTLADEIDLACANIEEDKTACSTICAPSVCCFNHYCIQSQDFDCLEYAGCYVLYTDLEITNDDDATPTTPVPSLADEIHAACFELGTINDATASSECTSLCAAGACCFETSLDCVDISCSTYAECNILYPSFLAVSQAEVEDACQNHRNVASGSEPTLCEQVCTLHIMQCCFHDNNEEGCDNVLQQPGTAYCNNYAACEVLGVSGMDLSDSHKAELEEICSNTQTRSQCIKLCSAATCCYASTIEETCANVDASITCDDYSACDILYDSSS